MEEGVEGWKGRRWMIKVKRGEKGKDEKKDKERERVWQGTIKILIKRAWVKGDNFTTDIHQAHTYVYGSGTSNSNDNLQLQLLAQRERQQRAIWTGGYVEHRQRQQQQQLQTRKNTIALTIVHSLPLFSPSLSLLL